MWVLSQGVKKCRRGSPAAISGVSRGPSQPCRDRGFQKALPSISAGPFDIRATTRALRSVEVRGAATLAENLRAQRENALLYRTLATLRLDVPIDESLNELRWSGPDRSALKDLCEEIGERTLLDRI